MTAFHFNTAESKNARRAWREFIDEKFGVSSVSIGDETTFAGDIQVLVARISDACPNQSHPRIGRAEQGAGREDAEQAFCGCLAAVGKAQNHPSGPRMRAQSEYVHVV